MFKNTALRGSQGSAFAPSTELLLRELGQVACVSEGVLRIRQGVARKALATKEALSTS